MNARLALNATTEAARAGEAGRDVGVVANEVKDLATATSTSVDWVNEVITAIVGETVRNRDTMGQERVSLETGQVTESFTATSTAVSAIQASQVEIAASVDEQAAVLAEVAPQLSTATSAVQAYRSASTA